MEMEELLLAIQQELQTRIVGIRDTDIFITPSLVFRPQGVKLPCIGIKDGRVVHKYLASESMEYTMSVRLVVFVKLTNKEAAIVGNSATGQNGILAINKQLITILNNNLLQITGMEEARITDDPESLMYITDKKEIYQRKELGLQYQKTV